MYFLVTAEEDPCHYPHLHHQLSLAEATPMKMIGEREMVKHFLLHNVLNKYLPDPYGVVSVPAAMLIAITLWGLGT